MTIQEVIDKTKESSEIIEEILTIIRRFDRENMETMAKLKAVFEESHDCHATAEDGCEGCPIKI